MYSIQRTLLLQSNSKTLFFYLTRNFFINNAKQTRWGEKLLFSQPNCSGCPFQLFSDRNTLRANWVSYCHTPALTCHDFKSITTLKNLSRHQNTPSNLLYIKNIKQAETQRKGHCFSFMFYMAQKKYIICISVIGVTCTHLFRSCVVFVFIAVVNLLKHGCQTTYHC